MKPRINLMNDYNYVAHPAILTALADQQGERFTGYGTDGKTDQAKAAILELFQTPGAEVHFIPAGTLTNLITISAFLRPHEAVIAPATGHIFMHETGAIEASGHKVLTAATDDGKLRPDDIISLVAAHTDEHMVKPRMVYISQTTECGSVYTLAELAALRQACNQYKLLLFIDGARLACAATSSSCDFSLPQMAQLADAIYLGGTKDGMLFGEALVICNPLLQDDFRFLIKQRGGLFAKGFLMGIQFLALLEDDLYLKLAAEANARAASLYEGLTQLGYDFEYVTESNLVIPIINNDQLAGLQEQIDFEIWGYPSANAIAIRFVTTWQTTAAEIQTVFELMTR